MKEYLLFSKLETLLSILCIIAAIRIGRVALSLLITSSTYLLQRIIDSDSYDRLNKLDDVTHEELISLWYNSFIMTDMLTVLAVYAIHRATQTPFNLFSRLFIYITTGIILLRIARCSERLFFTTEYLNAAYHWGIPIANFTVQGTMLIALAVIYKRSRDFGERIAWHG